MPLSTIEMQDLIRNHKKKYSNTNFLQQKLKISEFKKEKKASNVHVNLAFTKYQKDLFVLITHANETQGFPKH